MLWSNYYNDYDTLDSIIGRSASFSAVNELLSTWEQKSPALNAFSLLNRKRLEETLEFTIKGLPIYEPSWVTTESGPRGSSCSAHGVLAWPHFRATSKDEAQEISSRLAPFFGQCWGLSQGPIAELHAANAPYIRTRTISLSMGYQFLNLISWEAENHLQMIHRGVFAAVGSLFLSYRKMGQELPTPNEMEEDYDC